MSHLFSVPFYSRKIVENCPFVISARGANIIDVIIRLIQLDACIYDIDGNEKEIQDQINAYWIVSLDAQSAGYKGSKEFFATEGDDNIERALSEFPELRGISISYTSMGNSFTYKSKE